MTRIRCKVWLQIVMHEAVIVDDVVFFQQRNQLFTGVPSWCCIAFWWASGEGGQDFYGFFEDVGLLGEGEFGDVFVGVAVETACSI